MFDTVSKTSPVLSLSRFTRITYAFALFPMKEMSSHSDEAIVARVLRTKDPGLFGVIVTRYRNKLMALAATTLAGSPASSEVDDVVQDAFVSAYDHLSSFRAEGTFRPWLYRIVINKCINRRRVSGRTVSSPELLEQANNSPNPLTTVLNNEQANRISNAVDLLPPQQRAIFLLRHMDNLSYAELAQVTGLPEGSVKTNLFRARAKVREMIKDELI
jgi:RNA polymerase sigma-70 factor (ECF subfamily)